MSPTPSRHKRDDLPSWVHRIRHSRTSSARSFRPTVLGRDEVPGGDRRPRYRPAGTPARHRAGTRPHRSSVGHRLKRLEAGVPPATHGGNDARPGQRDVHGLGVLQRATPFEASGTITPSCCSPRPVRVGPTPRSARHWGGDATPAGPRAGEPGSVATVSPLQDVASLVGVVRLRVLALHDVQISAGAGPSRTRQVRQFLYGLGREPVALGGPATGVGGRFVRGRRPARTSAERKWWA